MSWRRILLLSLVFVLALGGATWVVLQRSGAATQIVARELQQVLATSATVDDTRIDLAAGRLSILGLRIADPTQEGRSLLAVDEAHLDVAANPLGAVLGMHAIVVDGVQIELGPRLPTLAEVVNDAGGGPRSSSPGRVPPIDLRRCRIRFTPRRGVVPLELRDVTLQLTPLEDSPHCAELSGTAEFVDLGTTVHLRGSCDLASGALRIAASVRDATIGAAARTRLQEVLGVDLAGYDAALRIRELTLMCTVPGNDAVDRDPVFDLGAELDGVRATAPGLPKLIDGATVTVRATTANGGSVNVRLLQESAAGIFDVCAAAKGSADGPSLDVRANGQRIRIDAEVLAALQTFDVGRDVVAALQPTTGRADVQLFLRDPHRPGGTTELELDLQDVAMSYQGFGDEETRASFPLPLVEARGRVRLREDVVLLEDVDAKIAPFAGGGAVRLVGRIETRKPAGEDASLDIEATGVAFSEHLRQALTALLHGDGSLYDRFSPTGRTEVAVHVRPRQVLLGGWSVEIRPTAATMQWAGFPYRLEELGGAVVARADGVGFDLTGTHGGGSLSMRGRIPVDPLQADGEPGFEAVVELRDIAVDDDLRVAAAVLAPELDEPWRKSAPTGKLGGHVKVWRPTPGDPLFHDVQLDLRGVDLQLPAAPWRAVGLQGQMFVQGSGSDTRIDFDALRGRLEHGADKPAHLAMLGTITAGASTQSDLAFVVRGLELDAQLGRSLEQLGALGSGAWNTLRASGTVDLVCRHERPSSGVDKLQLVVQLVDVRSESPILIRPADKMTGELTIGDGELRFRDVRAELEGALVQCSDGRVHTRPAPDGRTEIAFRVKANGLPVDDGMANLFSGPLRRAVLDRRLSGRADVDALSLQFAIPPEGNPLPFETVLDGQLRLYDVGMSLGQGAEGIRVRGINGVVGLAESRVSDTGGGLAGILRGVTLEVFGQPFEAIEAAFAADAERLQLESMTSRFHGGSVRSARVDAPALHYLLPGPAAPEGRLSANLAFEKVDVYSFLDTCGWVNPPYSGMASGDFALERLDGSNVVAAVASGQLTIERGNLGVVPLFTAIYAQLPAPDRPRFDHLASRFRLANRSVAFDRLDVTSNLLAANGRGTMELDGYLDIEMTLDNLLGTSADPIFMPLVDLLTKNIVRFHLFGYLRDLQAEKRWLTETSPPRRQVLPMPPASERPSLPDY